MLLWGGCEASETLIDVYVESTSCSDTVPKGALFQVWSKAIGQFCSVSGLVFVRIVDSTEMQHFNRTYADKDYPTNVLSFPSDVAPLHSQLLEDSEKPLGDILLNAEVIASEAAQKLLCEHDHWAHLFVHGVLHLAGYDHKIDADADVMEALEIDILGALKIDNPYSPT